MISLGAIPALAASPGAPPPLPHALQSQIGQLLLAALILIAIPISIRSSRAAAWYWILLGGPALAALLIAPARLPNAALAWTLYLAVWLLPVAALHAQRKGGPAPAPYRAGERWATHDDLRAHHLATWPQPSQATSAGTVWPPSPAMPWKGLPVPFARLAATFWPQTSARRTQPIVYGLDAAREGRHTLLVAPTGLGKGLWTTTQLLSWSGSAIVNDLKGDIYPQTSGWRLTLGPLYLLHAASPVHRFDPTASADTEDDLRPLAHAICTDPEDRDPYWAQYAARILLVLMLAAKRAREPVFPYVARLVHAGATRALAHVADVDPTLADRIRPHGDSRGFGSAWETLVTRCEAILSPSTLTTLSGTDFTAADLLRERATLYLQIPEARLPDLRPFLRLLWTSLIMQLVAASDRIGAAAHHPLLLLLDEAGRTPFAGLPDFLVTLRSRRISCAVLVQALSQLRAAYGPALAERTHLPAPTFPVLDVAPPTTPPPPTVPEYIEPD